MEFLALPAPQSQTLPVPAVNALREPPSSGQEVNSHLGKREGAGEKRVGVGGGETERDRDTDAGVGLRGEPREKQTSVRD